MDQQTLYVLSTSNRLQRLRNVEIALDSLAQFARTASILSVCLSVFLSVCLSFFLSFFLSLSLSLSSHTHTHTHTHGIRVCACMYRTPICLQSLRLSSAARQTTTVGEIVNLMSVDARKIQDAFLEIHEMWAIPITVVIGIVLLWQLLGLATLAGIIVLVIVMPLIGGGFTKLYMAFQVGDRVGG